MDLALNNLQWLICHKIKPNHTKHIHTHQRHMYTCTHMHTLTHQRCTHAYTYTHTHTQTVNLLYLAFKLGLDCCICLSLSAMFLSRGEMQGKNDVSLNFITLILRIWVIFGLTSAYTPKTTPKGIYMVKYPTHTTGNISLVCCVNLAYTPKIKDGKSNISFKLTQ